MKHLFLLTLVFGLVGCSRSPQSHEAAPSNVPVAVKVQRLAMRDWPVVRQAMGTVEARNRATVSAQIMGAIRQVHVEVGQSVRAGQTLVTLEARDLASAVAQAEAGQREAQSAQPEAERAIEAARAALELAETSHRRIEGLFQKKSVSPQEMDEATARLRQSRAALEMAQSRRGQIDARIASTKQAISSAQVMTGYTVVAAPFAGLVTEKLAQAGSLASPGLPLVTLEQAGGYRLVVSTGESDALRLGQLVRVQWEDGAPEFATKISEIVPAVDTATRTQTAKIDLPPQAGLRSGRFGRALWTAGQRQALTVPVTALRQSGQLQMVLVVEDGRLRSRMITAGENIQAGVVEVLAGLQPGELVVVRPPLEWKDGAPARVE